MCMGLKWDRCKGMMKSNKAKEHLIEVLQNSTNKSTEEIGKIFRLASRKECEYTGLEVYWNSIDSNNLYNKYEDIEGEVGFKFAHCVGTWRTSYFYCTSNLGRVLIVNLKDEKIKKVYESNLDTVLMFNKELNDKNCELIEIKDGFIANKNINKFGNMLDLTNEKNIYEFVRDSGWLENDDSKKIALKFSDKIEIHHINNCPNDNRIDNLIYLPKSIHSYSH